MTGELEKVEAHGLTDRQKRLVDGLVIGDADEWDVLRAAGYGEGTNLVEVSRSLPVQDALKRDRVATIRGPLARKALRTIEQLITNEKTPAATRFSAAKWVLEQAGHGNAQGEEGDKPLAEMTPDELMAFIRKTEQAIAEGKAPRTITVKPDNGA